MSQQYGKVDSALVEHHHFRSLSETAKLLCLFLRVSPRNNAIGCFYYPASQIADDLNTPFEGALKGLHELAERGFAVYCETTRWVWIPKYLTHFPVKGKNSGKHALVVLETIPREFSYWPALATVFQNNHDFGNDGDGRALEGAWAKLRRGFEGASKGLEPRARAQSTSDTASTTTPTVVSQEGSTELTTTPAHARRDGTHG